MSTRERNDIDFADIQGLARFGHGHLPETLFLLLSVKDAAQARAWLRQAPVANAVRGEQRPQYALQLALSAAGLRAIGVDDGVLSGFSDEFLAGMAGDGNRSRRLGDVARNAPQHWRWGGAAGEPDLLLLLYSAEGEMAAAREALLGPCFDTAFGEILALPAVMRSDKEPFGFADGISQPQVDWWGEVLTGPHERDRYSNHLAAGEVLLGYRNEYGLYTQRPLLDEAQYPAAVDLPTARDQAPLRDLGRNGSYLVMRQLGQDVAGFWQFLHGAAGEDEAGREQLAAAMVGRQRDGAPLVPSTGRNGFDYNGDPQGLQCPVGSHVRRANPRTGDFPPNVTGFFTRMLRIFGFGRQHAHDDLVASSRFHRLLRRGRAYGEALDPAQALLAQPGEGERGLHFVCLGANIARQFEFVQNAWNISGKFAGLEAEADPLLGNREPLPGGAASDRFTLPQADRPARCVEGLPQFVQVLGGGYFFLPGIRALRFLAREPG